MLVARAADAGSDVAARLPGQPGPQARSAPAVPMPAQRSDADVARGHAATTSRSRQPNLTRVVVGLDVCVLTVSIMLAWPLRALIPSVEPATQDGVVLA